MRKRTTVKKTTAKAANARSQKSPRPPKKRSSRKPAREKTVLTKIKDGLDETVARLRMLLPGEAKNNHSDKPSSEIA